MVRSAGCAVKSVQQVKLAHFLCAKESKVILLALVIYPIKLNNGSVRARNLAVTQKSPNLPQSHTKTFFALCGFHFLGVISIPTFQLAVIAQHYVLDFFFNSSWVLFELNQIRDID
jgi:hypothetical protein